MLIYQY